MQSARSGDFLSQVNCQGFPEDNAPYRKCITNSWRKERFIQSILFLPSATPPGPRIRAATGLRSQSPCVCPKIRFRQNISRRRPVRSPLVTSCVSSETQVQSTAPSSQVFDWINQWYPVALEVDLDPAVPTPFVINGRRLVVWRARAPDTKWVVFRDSCPHRFAALSEGRIDRLTGHLQCSYHGWQFTGTGGACAFIPQAPDQSVAASPQACATQLHSRCEAGLIFVWMGDKAPPSRARPPALVSGASTKQLCSSMTRDLPFSFLTLLMNVLDPAHIHFAHHGQIGRRELAVPVPIRMFNIQRDPGDVSSPCTAFGADYYEGRIQVRFLPPCLVEIQSASGESFGYYSIPIDEFRVRTIGIQLRSRRMFAKPVLPRWIDHIRRNALIDGDLTLMHSQEREMCLNATRSCKSVVEGWNFFTPTSADRLIIELRHWLQQNPPPKSRAADPSSLLRPVLRSELLNRFESHVTHCSSCRGALKNVRRAIVVGRVACILLLIAAATVGLGFHFILASSQLSPFLPSVQVSLKPSSSSRTIIFLGLSALFLVGIVAMLRSLERRFLYVESARKLTHGR
jgi:phenylpropionate dioxygenase-like ring-hydroxylating dioxygenase large terminal subunit